MHLLAALPVWHPWSKHTVLEIDKLADEPPLLLDNRFATLVWFEAACHIAHIDPSVLRYSAAPARIGFGIAIVPWQLMTISQEGIHTVRLIHQGASIGRWAMIARDSQCFLLITEPNFLFQLRYPDHDRQRPSWL